VRKQNQLILTLVLGLLLSCSRPTNIPSTATPPAILEYQLAYVAGVGEGLDTKYVVRVLSVPLKLPLEELPSPKDFHLPVEYFSPNIRGWSPAGEPLLITAQSSPGGDVFLINTLSGSMQQITNDRQTYACGWSPTEKNVVMILETDTWHRSLWDIKQQNFSPLPDRGFFCTPRNWMLYLQDGDLFEWSPETQQAKQLTFSPDTEEVGGELSPNGKWRWLSVQRTEDAIKIAGLDNPYAYSHLGLLDTATLQVTMLTDTAQGYRYVNGTTWSNDSQSIVFSAALTNTEGIQILQVDMATRVIHPLITHAHYPIAAPEGDLIAYVSDDPRGLGLFDLRTGQQQVIPDQRISQFTQPIWATTPLPTP